MTAIGCLVSARGDAAILWCDQQVWQGNSPAGLIDKLVIDHRTRMLATAAGDHDDLVKVRDAIRRLDGIGDIHRLPPILRAVGQHGCDHNTVLVCGWSELTRSIRAYTLTGPLFQPILVRALADPPIDGLSRLTLSDSHLLKRAMLGQVHEIELQHGRCQRGCIRAATLRAPPGSIDVRPFVELEPARSPTRAPPMPASRRRAAPSSSPRPFSAAARCARPPGWPASWG
jgi:hypothetical protein